MAKIIYPLLLVINGKRIEKIEIDLWQTSQKPIDDVDILIGVAQTLDGLNLFEKRNLPDEKEFFVIHMIEFKSKRYKLSFSIFNKSLEVHALLEYGINKRAILSLQR